MAFCFYKCVFQWIKTRRGSITTHAAGCIGTAADTPAMAEMPLLISEGAGLGTLLGTSLGTLLEESPEWALELGESLGMSLGISLESSIGLPLGLMSAGGVSVVATVVGRSVIAMGEGVGKGLLAEINLVQINNNKIEVFMIIIALSNLWLKLCEM
jgi:hypothetical protein